MSVTKHTLYLIHENNYIYLSVHSVKLCSVIICKDPLAFVQSRVNYLHMYASSMFYVRISTPAQSIYGSTALIYNRSSSFFFNISLFFSLFLISFNPVPLT